MLPGQVDQQLTAVGVKCDIRRGQGVEAPPPALPRLHVGDVARRKVGNAAGVGRVAGVARALFGSEDPGVVQPDVGVEGADGYLLGADGVNGQALALRVRAAGGLEVDEDVPTASVGLTGVLLSDV